VLHLERALGEVVHDAVRGDVLHRVGLADVQRVAPDDGAQLDLVVELEPLSRLHDRVGGAIDRAVGLDEEERLGRERGVHLVSVVGVVEADAHDLADAGERAAEPRSTANDGTSRRLDRAQLLEPGGREHRRCDVLHHARQIAQRAVLVDESWLLGSESSVAYELHRVGPPVPGDGRIGYMNGSIKLAPRIARSPAECASRMTLSQNCEG